MTGENSTEKNSRKGGISVETDHIFPIIKKWLYSDKDIFLREIVSNAADAITKMKRLCSLGEAEADGEGYKIIVRVDKAARTLTVEDNGVGMTEDELTRYICQIALSGALEFIEKYEGKSAEGAASSGIIGHFGL
ncbi:MAG TPA: ATP-binding protein, partial [Bacillota bacterium]|nr:ATP-binding protein [Bacillota bacterium]